MRILCFGLIYCVIFLFPAIHLAQDTLYVSPEGMDSGNTCDAPGMPCATISYALNLAENGGVIYLYEGTYTETLMLQKDISLLGEDESATIIQASDQMGEAKSRVITIAEGVDVSLFKMTIRHGVAKGDGLNGDGGGVYVINSTLQLNTITFSGNISSNGRGGAIYSNGSTGTMRKLTFTNNRAGKHGGGFYGRLDKYEMRQLTFEDNMASESGGGYYQYISRNKFSELKFRRNTAEGNGGGMALISEEYNGDNSDTLVNIEFYENSAGGNGGGFYVNMDTNEGLVIDRAHFEDNKSTEGGGMFQRMGKLFAKNLVFKNNSAENGGGYCGYVIGISPNRPYPSMRNSIFTGNEAGLSGGGIYLAGSRGVYFINVDFIKNSSLGTDEGTGGGAVCSQYDSWANFYNCRFGENFTRRHGGAVMIDVLEIINLTTRIHNCLFYKNSAEGDGGGIYVYKCSINIINTTLYGNECEGNGGALIVKSAIGKINVLNSILWGNNAIHNGNELYATSGELLMNYCLYDDEEGDIVGSGFSASNSLSDDPRFRDAEEGDLRLLHDSPVIDKGSEETDPNWFIHRNDEPIDLNGEKRFINERIDLGPYEYDPTASLTEVFPTKLGLRVYPNPTRNYVTLKAETLLERVEIYDLFGISHLSSDCHGKTTRINVAHLSPGAYFLRVYVDGNSSTLKFIKQ